jgi:hypothetical protein
MCSCLLGPVVMIFGDSGESYNHDVDVATALLCCFEFRKQEPNRHDTNGLIQIAGFGSVGIPSWFGGWLFARRVRRSVHRPIQSWNSDVLVLHQTDL